MDNIIGYEDEDDDEKENKQKSRTLTCKRERDHRFEIGTRKEGQN